MKDPNHLHKLKRHHYKTGGSIYFCVNDCSFRVSCNLSLGKIVECWRCGKPFQMNKYSITLDKPHCEGCNEPKNKNYRLSKVKPLTAIANLAAKETTKELRERLNAVMTEPSKPKSEISEPESIVSKTSEIREFQIEEDEDYL